MNPKYKGTFNRYPWWNQGTINATSASADVALAATERTFQDVKDLTNVVWYSVAAGITALGIRFSLLADNDDADIDIWIGSLAKPPGEDSSVDCELMRAGVLDVIASAQVGVIATDFFADRINVSNDLTPKGIFQPTPDLNVMVQSYFDLAGENIVVFHGYGTVDSAVKVWLRGYA